MRKILSALYGYGVRYRNRQFDLGKRPIVRTTVPVISVGNLSVGGTGKTPAVQLVTELLRLQGHKPAIVMRGYKRSSRGVLLVNDGNRLIVSTLQAGDEATLHAKKTGVPVVVGEYKADAAVFAAGNTDCDVIVVDDGFQHRSLYRDLDIVIVDEKTVNNAALIPAGRLREPLANLARADVVFTYANVPVAEIQHFCNDAALIAQIELVATCDSIKGASVLCLSAIANPERFVESAKHCGATVHSVITYPDHHWYSVSDVAKVIDVATKHNLTVVTTEKDAVKLESMNDAFAKAGIRLVTLPVTLHVRSGMLELNNKFESLFHHCK